MSFAHPWWLLLALPALAAGWFAYRRLEPRRASMAFPEGDALAEAGGGAFQTALPYALKTLALLLAVAALARPQVVERRVRSVTRGIDILLVLDTSTSMRAVDFDPTDRMGAAVETAKRFVSGRADDRIGVLVFGGAPILACPLTMDYEAVGDYLGGVEAGMTRTEGTAIGDGIAAAVDHLKSSRAKSRVIVLLTDGSSNTGAIDPVTAAKAAQTYGVKIYAIGTGRRGEALAPIDTPFGRRLQRIPDELDEDVLTRVAAIADGRYFRATNFRELVEIYSEIDRLEKTDAARPEIVTRTDLYPWLVLPAFMLLAGEMALARTVLLRIP